MILPGDWGAGDDRRMLKALFRSGAVNEWDVDWSALVPGRHAGLTKVWDALKSLNAAPNMTSIMYTNVITAWSQS